MNKQEFEQEESENYPFGDIRNIKETSFPITNQYKDLKEIDVLFKKKPKVKKAHWHKGKLKYK